MSDQAFTASSDDAARTVGLAIFEEVKAWQPANLYIAAIATPMGPTPEHVGRAAIEAMKRLALACHPEFAAEARPHDEPRPTRLCDYSRFGVSCVLDYGHGTNHELEDGMRVETNGDRVHDERAETSR